MRESSEERILTVKEVAEMLQLKESTVCRYCREKQIPHFKLGCYYRFKESDIWKWINKSVSNSIKLRQ